MNNVVQDLTEETLFAYAIEHSNEFVVTAVDTDLRTLISGENYKTLILKSLPKFESHEVTDISSASVVFEAMGFNLYVSELTGTARMVDPAEVRVRFDVWMKFVIEAIVPMWEGFISCQIVHRDTGRTTIIQYFPQDLMNMRDSLGLQVDQPLETQLLALFEKLHSNHNPESYTPLNPS